MDVPSLANKLQPPPEELDEFDELAEEGDLINPDFPNSVIYGPTGHGKTTFTMNAPDPEWWDYEHSTDVLPDEIRLDTNRVHQLNESTNVHAETLHLLRSIERRGHKTVVIDSVTSMLDKFLLEHMLEVEKESKGKRTRYEPLFQDYRKTTGKMREIFYELGKAKVNVIFIAHELEVWDQVDANTTRLVCIRPELTPRVELILRRLVSLIAYMEASYDLRSKRTFKLVVNPGYNKIVAKNRLRIMQPFLENPTWEELFSNRPKIGA